MTLPRALVACRASQVFLAAAARAYIEIYVLPRWRGAHRDQGRPPRPRGGVVVSVGRAVWSLLRLPWCIDAPRWLGRACEGPPEAATAVSAGPRLLGSTMGPHTAVGVRGVGIGTRGGRCGSAYYKNERSRDTPICTHTHVGFLAHRPPAHRTQQVLSIRDTVRL